MTQPKYKHLEEVRVMIEACFRCGDCRIGIRPAIGRDMVCPIYDVIPGKWEPFFARGKILLANGLLNNEIELTPELAEIIFQCMICGSCEAMCNHSYHPSLKHPLKEVIDHPKIWEAFRAELSDAGYSLPRHAEILDCCTSKHNPYFEDPTDRARWLPEGKEFPKEADFLLFMGCTESYRSPEILQTIVKILDRSGINYTILGTEEWCCGSIAIRTGNRKVAQKLAQHNADAFHQVKATRIITHCAGCYKTLRDDYPQLLSNFPYSIQHITELIEELLNSGALKLSHEIPHKVTYHDPCHLGRHSEVYDTPRAILQQIPGIEFIEMRRIRENSWCCGAGGGLKSVYPEITHQIAKTRIQEALETGADTLVTVCPFCLQTLQDAAKELTHNQPIQVLDLFDLVLKAI